MIGRYLRMTLVGLICVILMSSVTGCQRVRELLTPPDPFLKESEGEPTLLRYEEAFAKGLDDYEKSHPADLLRPEKVKITVCPAGALSEAAPASGRYAVLSEGIAFGEPAVEEESGKITLPVVALNAEKEVWIRQQICTDPCFESSSFVMVTEENPAYQRTLPVSIREFFGRALTYEKSHEGSVITRWSGISLRPGVAGIERRIDFVLRTVNGGMSLVCLQPLTEGGKEWFEKALFPDGLPGWVIFEEPGQLAEGAEPEEWKKSTFPEELESPGDVMLSAEEKRISAKDASIGWNVVNRESRMVFADRAPVLERKVEETWREVPSQYEGEKITGSLAGTIGVTVQPDESAGFALDLEIYVPLAAGEYRIVQRIGQAPDTSSSKTVAVLEFTVE